MKTNIIFTLIIGIFIGIATGSYIGYKAATKLIQKDTSSEKIITEPIEKEEDGAFNKEIEMPNKDDINNTEDETISFKVYFTTLNNNENLLDCSKVDWVTRSVPKTKEVAKAALDQLFLAPTTEEKNRGLKGHWITKEMAYNLKRVFIKDGTAYLDWADISKIIPNASTNCGIVSFLSPIDATLKQFPSITRVVHAINGQPSIFYNWMQMGCPKSNNNCDETPYK